MAKTQINLLAYSRAEKQPFGRATVFVYHCSAAKHEVRVKAGGKMGKRWTATPGAIYCPQCERA